MTFENQNAWRVRHKNDRNILTTKKQHFPRERSENFFEFRLQNRHTLYARDVQRKGKNIPKPHGWTRIVHILHVSIMGRMIPCVITRCRIGKTGWSVGGCIPRRGRAYSTVPITYTYDSNVLGRLLCPVGSSQFAYSKHLQTKFIWFTAFRYDKFFFLNPKRYYELFIWTYVMFKKRYYIDTLTGKRGERRMEILYFFLIDRNVVGCVVER